MSLCRLFYIHSLTLETSHWFYQAGAVHQHNHARQGKGPELRTIYQRFTHLAEAPVIVVLVLDGPDRPELKRGRQRKSNREHWLVDDVCDLARAFGFIVHQVFKPRYRSFCSLILTVGTW